MTEGKEFFDDNFTKSLGSLFRDFYSQNEISYLRNEIYKKYESIQDSEIEIDIYEPGSDDPLLRIQHKVILITCGSLPFFASRIRKVFELLQLEISRSLHFHPNPGKELFYIEVLGSKIHVLKNLTDGIKSSYSRIQKLTLEFRQFNQPSADWMQWERGVGEFLKWLLDRAYVWEAAIYTVGEKEQKFGDVNISDELMHWFYSLESSKAEIEALESEDRSFLGDERYYYIALVDKNRKMLLCGSLNQFAKASALMDIPYFNKRFSNFFEKESIEAFSGLGRTSRMMFNYLPTEIILLLPEEIYIQIHSSILEQNLRNRLGSTGIKINDGLGLLISFIPKANWTENLWETSDAIIHRVFENSTVHRYFIVRNNFVECFHLVRARDITIQNLLTASSTVEFSFRSWMEHLESKWNDHFQNEYPVGSLSFHDDYKATHNADQAILDIGMAIKLAGSDLNVEITERYDTTIIHAVTPKMRFLLSEWVKVLSDLGLAPISQRVYHFQFKEITYAKSEFFFHLIENKKGLYKRLKQVLMLLQTGQIRSDSLSSVILWSELDENGLLFLKAVRDYCLQSNAVFNADEFNQYLVAHPDLVIAAWEYFRSSFSEGIVKSKEQMIAESDTGKTIREDAVLHAFSTTVLSIIRTDFYGTRLDSRVGVDRDFISFKIDSSIPSALPKPRPYREIFVYSADYQGIHLRGGKVARGGIRWSDRPSDYRTELLGLLKTQMVKNSIIIPVGSKGSFVLTPNGLNKNSVSMQSAYSGFISGLLGLTDNRLLGEIFPYSETIPSTAKDLDIDDSYLVVAADKGTAALSDLANSLSEKAKFWLGDAFASGGSKGYSHKAYGITAKGALVTADRNFRMMGVDFRRESVTVVGIGDMGGDVFGNGLLESKYFKLVAAFNHKHIFIDPNPDPAISFEERKRLFYAESPSLAGWDNYDLKLISQGGGIWNRTEKSISLSIQAQEILGIKESKLSGNELIRAILSAPVDMLYNGGIGTYVKSSQEEQVKVGDPANNDVRIDANELRCKLISEGGNLGLTQQARLDYDRLGGYVFTDAIDNSAGVDLSDHEVNLKIFMNELLNQNILKSIEERDNLLFSLDKEVVESVLLDNELQSLSINVDRLESETESWSQIIEASNYLVNKSIIEPGLNRIPANTTTWEELSELSTGIPRPSLAVIMGHAKMYLYQICLGSNVFNIDDFENLYIGYFPTSLVQKYKKQLLNHPLHLEICTTRAVNFLVNLMGSSIICLLPKDELEIPRFLKSMLDDLVAKDLPRILDQIANIRDAKLEKNLLELVSSVRKSIHWKWSRVQANSSEMISNWESVIPKESLENLTAILRA
ncbi:NAD-glutamate dehydrogenase domain-containing protein [Leptospira sp. GIMC2001]|uniref:NAD-glutamate dehydrogenase domain-containing protein n=1 Tax=Leptospira sp. GIMC2001 TaxID=1513297 RepID=UPI00234AB3A4|nr:NAD-glutamate dehydrogenase domain-containing protein [Leptospira sp. GIMC2001]WCL50618.1 NAD-glutamate dehydrogenase [Leptospira sp. GIMC2001]